MRTSILSDRHSRVHDRARSALVAARPRAGSWRAAGVRTVGWLLVFFLWNALLTAALLLPPTLGVVWLPTTTAALAWWFLARRGIPRRRRAALRLRRPRGDLRVVALAALPLLALTWTTVVLAAPYVTMPDQSHLERIMRAPLGTLRLVAFAVLAAPLVEELFFRGFVQRTFDRCGGPAAAIAVTSLVFALAHMEPALIPQRFAAGLALGYVVLATGSLWSGFLLHALFNGACVAIAAAGDALGVPVTLLDPEQAPRVWQMTVGAALLAAASVGWLLDLKRRLDASIARPAAGRAVAHDEDVAVRAA